MNEWLFSLRISLYPSYFNILVFKVFIYFVYISEKNPKRNRICTVIAAGSCRVVVENKTWVSFALKVGQCFWCVIPTVFLQKCHRCAKEKRPGTLRQRLRSVPSSHRCLCVERNADGQRGCGVLRRCFPEHLSRSCSWWGLTLQCVWSYGLL